jgi:elongation factor Ts
MNQGKPAAIVEKMVQGRLEKFYQDVCLLEQPFVKNPDVTVDQLIKEHIARLGEQITVRRFARFERGEAVDAASST